MERAMIRFQQIGRDQYREMRTGRILNGESLDDLMKENLAVLAIRDSWGDDLWSAFRITDGIVEENSPYGYFTIDDIDPDSESVIKLSDEIRPLGSPIPVGFYPLWEIDGDEVDASGGIMKSIIDCADEARDVNDPIWIAMDWAEKRK